MAARTFRDSTGTDWEVFEVRRTSQKAEAVSAGLERGWLAFVSAAHKRRLAPFPADWESADLAELERLCGLARAARGSLPARNAGESKVPSRDAGASEKPARDASESEKSTRDARTRVPRIRAAKADRPAVAAGGLPVESIAQGEDSVEATVREFAHQARAHGLPAIEAMVRLKALLTRVFTNPASAARDLRAVRRWFVEAYYFDRDAASAAPEVQAR